MPGTAEGLTGHGGGAFRARLRGRGTLSVERTVTVTST